MNARNFPLQGTITYEIVDEAHKRILMIAKEIKKVLNKHDISYSIFFGTVIGAVRHKGFIPWDMDMDFGVFSDYEKTISILREELPPWLVVLDQSSDPYYCASWAKIVDRFSEFHATTFSGDNVFRYKGLHVDLYNIQETTYNQVCSYRKKEAIAYYDRRIKAGTISEADYRSQCARIESFFNKEISDRNTINPDKPILAFLHFFEGEPDCMFPLREYEFEGERFSGPNDYDKFLKGCYYKGDYMQLPPYENRDMKMDGLIIYPLP